MKNRYFKTFILLAFAAIFPVKVSSETSDSTSYANLNKTATFNYETQQGEITLESYVTGISKVTQEARPVDVVLVLDYSSSMGDSYSTHNNYTKYVVDKKYYGANTYIKLSKSFTIVQNQTTAITTGTQLYSSDKDGTEIKVKYNGTDHNVYLLRALLSTPNSYGPPTYTSRNWAYIVDESDSRRVFLRQDGSFVKEKEGTSATVGYNSSSWPKDDTNCVIPPAHSETQLLFCTLTQTTASTTTRTNALQAAAGNFIDAITQHASENSLTDRIAIVSFQNAGTNTYPTYFGSADDYINSTSDYYLMDFPTDVSATSSTTTNSNLGGRSMVNKKFTDVSSYDATKFLKFAISGVSAVGNTPVNLGLDLADKLVAKFGRTDANVAKFVILFTDGEPTTTSSTGVWDNDGVADMSVASAYSLKHTRGYTVYSVYCNSSSLNSSSDTYKFLDYCSSNWPDATVYKETETKTHGSKLASDKAIYFKTAQDNLAIVFEGLTTEITEMAGVKYGKETLLKDFINNTYFKMPDNIVKSDIKIYEQKCTSVTGTSPNIVYGFDNICDDATNRCWHVGATEAAAATSTRPKLNITIQRADPNVAGSLDRVLIDGYDYSADDNWCGLRKSATNTTGTAGGHRLVVKFPYEIKVQKDSTATGALKTNGEDSGIYEAIEDSNGKKPGEEGYTATYADTAATNYPMPIIYFASLNITRDSLDKGESAIYDIYQTLPDSAETKVGRLSINGSGKGTDSKIMYGLAGAVGVKYRVQETDWNWAYHNGSTQEMTRTIKQKSSTETTVPESSSLNFNFSGKHMAAPSGQEDTSPYSMFNHDEEYKVNTMTIPLTTP